MENRALEIHDSTLQSISVCGGEAVVHFSSAYVHQSLREPGTTAGTGWTQEAIMRVRDTVVEGSFSELPDDVQSGYVKLRTTVLENLLPMPLHYEGVCEIRMEARGQVVCVTGTSMVLELIGKAMYIEEFRLGRA